MRLKIITLFAMLLSSAAFGQRIVLNMDDEHFTGRSVIHLKQEIRDHLGIRPGQLDDLELEEVTLIAKSRQGNGEGRLRIGQDETRWMDIDDGRGNFNDDDLDSYDRIDFENPNSNNNSRGVWQIHLQGNIKVKRIVLQFDDGNHDDDDDIDDERLVLRFNNEQFRGNSTIHLKQEIRNQLGINIASLRDVELKSVEFIAKSRQGNGRASLRVGRNETNNKRIGDGHGSFNDNDADSYDRVRFDNPNRNDRSRGVWQLHFRGNIKVKRIVIRLNE
jgi:hypothetical protein